MAATKNRDILLNAFIIIFGYLLSGLLFMAHEFTKSLLATTICRATTILHKWLVNFRFGTRRNNFTTLNMSKQQKLSSAANYFMERPLLEEFCSFNHLTIAYHHPKNMPHSWWCGAVARILLCATIWRNKESLDLWLLEIILLIVCRVGGTRDPIARWKPIEWGERKEGRGGITARHMNLSILHKRLCLFLCVQKVCHKIII